MCGIAGVFNYRTRRPADKALLGRMLDCIAHRGPDSRGVHVDGEFGFGMVRLAIIGGAEADQPMWTADRRLGIVFNGEIYNYRDVARELGLDTGSDTRALLELIARRGPQGLGATAGMFAAAAFDPVARSLLLFRDRFGKKPLWVADTPDGVAFASEIKALLMLPGFDPEIDRGGIAAFLNLSYMPPGWSPVERVHELPAASFRQFGAAEAEARYWEPRPAEPAGDFHERFDLAVRRRLVSDVPIGVFLSGGMDSNAVLARAIALQPGSVTRAYTIAPDTGESEAELARRTCAHFGIPLEEVEVSPRTVLDNIGRVVETADSLLANPPMFALDALSSAAAGRLKVILTGAGGDELFFGYPTWKADWLFRVWRRTPGPLQAAVRAAVRAMPVDYSPHALSYALDKFVTCPSRDPRDAHAWWRTVIAGEELRGLGLGAEDQWSRAYDEGYRFAERHAEGFVRQTALADVRLWWQGMGLRLADAVPMGRGVEVRSPFMDHDLYQWTLAAPLGELYHPLRSKPFLRRELRGSLPPWIVESRKKPFYVPLAQWLRGPLATLARDELSAGALRAQGLLEPAAAQRIVDEHMQGLRDNSFKILALLVLTLWHRRVYQAYRARR
jgi:asparagine synthase (glutamine-hydrolysing)